MSLDALILTIAYRLLRLPKPTQAADDVLERKFDPDAQFAVFYARGVFWLGLYPVFGLAWLAGWGILRAADLIGHGPLVPVFLFGAAFCIVGASDALWRHVLVWEARRRYRRANRKLDSDARRLLRLAQLNDATMLLQIAGGIFAAVKWS